MKTLLILTATALLLLGVVGLLIPSTNAALPLHWRRILLCVECFRGSDAARKGLKNVSDSSLNCSEWTDNRATLKYTNVCREKEITPGLPGAIGNLVGKMKKKVEKKLNEKPSTLPPTPWPKGTVYTTQEPLFDPNDSDFADVQKEMDKMIRAFIRLPPTKIVQGQCQYHKGTWNGEEVEWSTCKHEDGKNVGAGCKDEDVKEGFQGRICTCGTNYCNQPSLSTSALVGPSFGVLVMGLLLGVGGALLPLLFQ